MEQGYGDLVWRVLDMRSFAKTREDMEQARKNPKATIEIGPETQLVEEITVLADREVIEERRRRR